MESRRRSARLTAVKLEVEAEAGRSLAAISPVKVEQEASVKPAAKRKRVKTEAVGDESKPKAGQASQATVKPRRKKVKAEDGPEPTQEEKKVVRKRAVKKEADPLMDPTNTEAEMYAFEGNEWWVGAHMSVAGGVENSVSNARLYGCQAWALFLRPKMQWECRPISEDNIRLFAERLPLYKYDTKRCLPHASYLINLGNPDKEKRAKSLDAFLDELRRCALLKIGLYNFHPGSGVGEISKEEACTNIAMSINAAHASLLAEGLNCPIILLENMAGQGKQVGGRFEELALVIEQVHDKTRVGVCLDTAHAFASGFDIRTKEGFESMMSDFDRCIGIQYLKGVHMNDSLTPLASNKDRHANIGSGEIGLPAFHCIMNDARFKGIPLVLETPAASWKIWQGEIQALYALQGLPHRQDAWTHVAQKLAVLRKLEKEMEKSNSLADGSKAAKRAAEGKPPLVKRKRQTKTKGERKVNTQDGSEAMDRRGSETLGSK